MMRRVGVVLVLVTLLVLAGAIPALAEAPQAPDPTMFALGRGFAEFTFESAGEGDISIELGYAPGDAIATSGVTLKVYCPDGSVESASGISSGWVSMDLACTAEGTYTVEVANYHEALTINFWLVVHGDSVSNLAAVVAEAPAEAVAEEEVAAEVETEEAAVEEAPAAPAVLEKEVPVAFSLLHGFSEYTFERAAEDTTVTVELGYAPGDAIATSGVTLKVYCPDGSVESASGISSGWVSMDLACTAEGTYTVEVANYHEALTINFWLVVHAESAS